MTVVRRAATAAAALVALGTGAVPATAADAPSRLTLSVVSADGTMSRGVTLDCDPANGPHPNARDACAELDAAGGGFERLTPAGHLCPMIYAPVTATATGSWHGQQVYWTRSFPNACFLDQSTGAVFRF